MRNCAKLRPGSTPMISEEGSMSRLISAFVLLVLAGCAGADEVPDTSAADSSGSAAEALTAADVERFLKVVHDHKEAMIPEFTPPDEEEPLDSLASASQLVESFQPQCRPLFDVRRQGAIWKRDTPGSPAMAVSNIGPAPVAPRVSHESRASKRVML